MNSYVEESHFNRVMIDIAKKVIVVTDSSKFRRRSFAVIAPVTKADIVITDSAVSPNDQQELENFGVKVMVV